MSALAELAVSEDNGVVLVRVQGEVDMSNAGDIGVQIQGSVPNTAFGLVLDLSTSRYVDSSGLKLVFDLHSRLQSRQQVLALVVPKGGLVHRVFEIAGAEKVLNLHESVEPATEQVRPAGEQPVPEPLV